MDKGRSEVPSYAIEQMLSSTHPDPLTGYTSLIIRSTATVTGDTVHTAAADYSHSTLKGTSTCSSYICIALYETYVACQEESGCVVGSVGFSGVGGGQGTVGAHSYSYLYSVNSFPTPSLPLLLHIPIHIITYKHSHIHPHEHTPRKKCAM